MIYVICNPVAGHGRGKQTGALIEKALKEKNLPAEMHFTTKPRDAVILSREAAEKGCELVLAIGGDGTAFEAAQGLAGMETALGVIPAGTGNDFVKTIGIPSKPLEALNHILSCPVRKTDVGMLSGRLFLNEIGTGFDVMTLDYTEKVKHLCRGILPYFYGVLQTVFRFRSIPLTYAIDDGKEITEKVFIIGAANGRQFGGGITIAPDAKVDDGLMDVIVVGHIRKRDLPARLIGLMQGKILSFPETKFFRARKLRFSTPDMRVNADGEILPLSQAEVEIMPGALLMRR